MSSDHTVVGRYGRIVLPTRGAAGPGEVSVAIRGGRETFTAHSEAPLAVGTEVVVYNDRGHRAVDVVQLEDGIDP